MLPRNTTPQCLQYFDMKDFEKTAEAGKLLSTFSTSSPERDPKNPPGRGAPPPRSRGREHPCLRGTLRRSSSPQFTTLTHSLWPSYFYDCSRFIKHSTEILACNWVFISWCSLHATSNVHWILLHTFPPLICLYQFNFQTQPGTPAGLRKHFLPSPPEAPPSIHGQLILGGGGARTSHGQRTVFSTDGAGTTGESLAKEWGWPLPDTVDMNSEWI